MSRSGSLPSHPEGGCQHRRKSMKAKQPTGDADLDGLSSAVDDILTGHQLEVEQSGYATLYLGVSCLSTVRRCTRRV